MKRIIHHDQVGMQDGLTTWKSINHMNSMQDRNPMITSINAGKLLSHPTTCKDKDTQPTRRRASSLRGRASTKTHRKIPLSGKRRPLPAKVRHRTRRLSPLLPVLRRELQPGTRGKNQKHTVTGKEEVDEPCFQKI